MTQAFPLVGFHWVVRAAGLTQNQQLVQPFGSCDRAFQDWVGEEAPLDRQNDSWLGSGRGVRVYPERGVVAVVLALRNSLVDSSLCVDAGMITGHPEKHDVTDLDAVLVAVGEKLHPVEVLKRLEEPVAIRIDLKDPDSRFLYVGHGIMSGLGGDIRGVRIGELEHAAVDAQESWILRHVAV